MTIHDDEYLRSVANSPFVRNTNTAIWESMSHLGTPRNIPKGGLVYHQGDATSDFYYLKAGRVKIFTGDPAGLERLITIFEPGNTFGEAAAFDGLPCYVSAMAIEKSLVYAFNAKRILEVMTKDAALLHEIINELAHKQRILALQAESMSFYNPSERVALLVAHLTATYGTDIPGGSGRRVSLHATLEEIAGILGLSRVTISREIAKLQSEGILTKDRRDIVVLDRKALQLRLPSTYRVS
jgi:CRP/FNR family transcriptional regulator, cyclic AMP receptor protein